MKKKINNLKKEIAALLKSLKGDIQDDYRATDDSEDNTPGMCVTIGVTFKDGELSWGYQTGDNSFTGGAYGHANWGIAYLGRRSNTKELANLAVEEALEQIGEYQLLG